MKAIIFFIPLFLWSVMSRSQDTIQYARYKIVKKNHISFIGEIMGKTADGPYKIKLENGALVEVKEQDIYRMKPLHSRHENGIFEAPGYKWGMNTELMAVSNGVRNIGSPSISTGLALSGQYYLNFHLALGAGVGLYNYDLDARRMLMPVFADVKWRLVKNYSTPVIQFKSGYGFISNNFINGLADKKGGMFYNPFFGYEFGVTKKISWTMGVGMILQKAYYAYTEGSTFVDEDILFRRTEFKIAIAIH